MSSRVRAGQPSPQATPVDRRAILLSGLALPLGMMTAGNLSASAPRPGRPAALAVREAGPGLLAGQNLAGSTHATFTDFAALVPQVAPVLGEPPSWVTNGIGTISGDRAVTVERAYLNAWFGTYLGHRDSPLLSGPSPRYPEVRFTR